MNTYEVEAEFELSHLPGEPVCADREYTLPIRATSAREAIAEVKRSKQCVRVLSIRLVRHAQRRGIRGGAVHEITQAAQR